jgi:hypothetical protein
LWLFHFLTIIKIIILIKFVALSIIIIINSLSKCFIIIIIIKIINLDFSFYILLFIIILINLVINFNYYILLFLAKIFLLNILDFNFTCFYHFLKKIYQALIAKLVLLVAFATMVIISSN